MPTLQVRDIPEHIYHKLLDDAKKQHRSLAQQTIITLSKALETDTDPKKRRKRLIARIRASKLEMNANCLKNPADMIREDRDRR